MTPTSILTKQSVVEVLLDRLPRAQFRPRVTFARLLPDQCGEEADPRLLLTKHGLRKPCRSTASTLRQPEPKGASTSPHFPPFAERWSVRGANLARGTRKRCHSRRGTGVNLWVPLPRPWLTA